MVNVDSCSSSSNLFFRHGKLEEALTKYKDYGLRITGHSLGAGVASVLSIFLRPKYPNLRCLAFSPPGCTMSESLAESVSDYTYSFVVDGDIVARMSVEGFEELRDTVLEMIYRIKIGKYKVWNQSKTNDFSSLEGLTESIEDALYEEENTRDSKFKQQVNEFWRFQVELKERNKEDYHKLCLPGTLIQLFRTHTHRPHRRGKNSISASFDSSNLSMNTTDDIDSFRTDTKNINYRYTARYADRRDFEKIEISSHMLLDHDPIGVKKKMQQVALEQLALKQSVSKEDLVDGGLEP